MSMGIGHFAFGASGKLVMIQTLPLHARLRIRIAQVFIVLLVEHGHYSPIYRSTLKG